MLLLIDNFDSFAHNLARYFVQLGQPVEVVRNHEVSVPRVKAMQPDAIILSPGPCTPAEAGCSVEVVRRLGSSIPMLGVCLGHQVIVAAYGGRIVRTAPMHGRASEIHHDRRGVFADVCDPFSAARYHSLIACRSHLPRSLQISAWLADGSVMAVRHENDPVVGLQFHPESVLTPAGYQLLSNFLRLAGLESEVPLREAAWESATLGAGDPEPDVTRVTRGAAKTPMTF